MTKTLTEPNYNLNCYQNVYTLDITVSNIVDGLKILQTLKSDKLKRLSLKAGLDYDISVYEDEVYDKVVFTIIITPDESSDVLDSAIFVKKFQEKIQSIKNNLTL